MDGQPPLSILDLPGLVSNQSSDIAHREAADALVTKFLNPDRDDGSYVLPIFISKASDGFHGMRADLVEHRPFLAVLTHADHLLQDMVCLFLKIAPPDTSWLHTCMAHIYGHDLHMVCSNHYDNLLNPDLRNSDLAQDGKALGLLWYEDGNLI